MNFAELCAGLVALSLLMFLTVIPMALIGYGLGIRDGFVVIAGLGLVFKQVFMEG